MKKIILSSLLSSLLVTGLVATPFIYNHFHENGFDDHIETQVIDRGISIKKLNSTTNADGSVTKTFSFTVSPSDATSDLVEARVYYKDGSSCSDVVTCFVDNDANTISVTCKGPFGQQIILKVTSMSDKDVSASITVDYLQDWPVASAKTIDDDMYDYPFMIGAELNGDEVNYFPEGKVDFTALFDIDYGIYSKAKNYSYSGIENEGSRSGKVVDYSRTISEDMKSQMITAAWSLLFKMNNEHLNWSKELIWNLINTNEYKTALYNSMISYDYEDCGSYIELTWDHFGLLFTDNDGSEITIGTLETVKFRIDITDDYSSLATSVTGISGDLSGIDF